VSDILRQYRIPKYVFSWPTERREKSAPPHISKDALLKFCFPK